MTRPLPLLVTLGSPLGLLTLVYEKLRPQPPTFPAKDARWVNVADRDAYIAAEPDLTAMFSSGTPDGAIFEGGFSDDNGAEPHRADHYMTKETVGRPIGEVLSVLPWGRLGVAYAHGALVSRSG